MHGALTALLLAFRGHSGSDRMEQNGEIALGLGRVLCFGFSIFLSIRRVWSTIQAIMEYLWTINTSDLRNPALVCSQ